MIGGRLAVMLLCALVAQRAAAQGELFETHGAFPGDAAVESEAREARLRVAVGAGVGVAPRFPGSDNDRAHLAPAIHLAYGPFFFGAGGLGVVLHRARGWRFGLNLLPGAGRKESDDPHLAGLGDIDRTLRAGAFAVYLQPGWLARLNVATDIAGNHQGTIGRADVFLRLRGGEGLGFFGGPGITWGNREYMQAFFGVSADQSARSGLPAFDAGAGIASARLSAGAVYRLNARWRMVGSYSVARLTGDAGSSPITESRTQQFFLLSAVYLIR